MSHAEKASIDFEDLHELDAPALPDATPSPVSKSGGKCGLDPALGAKRSVPTLARFNCSKCRGSGRFISYSHRDCGPCNRCRGTGKQKTDPQAAERRRLKKAEDLGRKSCEWGKAHEPEVLWMHAALKRGFDFARAMLDAYARFGELTENQLAAVRKCMARDVERAKERAERKPDAQVAGAGFSRMLAAFAAAGSSGLKWPKFIVGRYTFKPAGATSKNAGCLYVTRETIYVGRVTNEGHYFATPAAEPGDRVVIGEICSDPLTAAVMHGKETGNCSCCGRHLENAESVERGIGPICARKWGLA